MKLSAQKQNAIGLLLLRLVFAGTLLYGHGWGKLMGWSERSAVFPDPIGLGSPVALALAIGAEVFCALLVIFGLFTRVDRKSTRLNSSHVAISYAVVCLKHI